MEIDLITQDRSILPYMWLSATEGDNSANETGILSLPDLIIGTKQSWSRMRQRSWKLLRRFGETSILGSDWKTGQSHTIRAVKMQGTVTPTIA